MNTEPDATEIIERFGLVAAGVLGWKGATAIWDAGLVPMYGTAAAVMLAAYAIGFVALLAAIVRPLHPRATWLIPTSIGVVLLCYTEIHVVAELESGNVLTTDALLFCDHAARLLRRGENPYEYDMVESFRTNRIPLLFSTPAVDGNLSGRVAYPAMSFLPFVVAQVLGIPTAALIPTVGLLGLVLLFVWSPPKVRPLVLLPFAFDQSYILYTLGGVTDAVWAVLMLAMLRAWPKPAWAALWFGLACAYKQQAWVLAPFVVVRILHDTPGGRRDKWEALARFTARSVAVFAVVNLPFIVWNAEAWWRGVTEPVFGQLVFFGQGLSSLTMTGDLIVPKAAYSLVSLGLLGVFVAVYARWYAAMRPFMWIAPGLALWFSHRSLTSYWYFFVAPLVLDLFTPRTDEAPRADWRALSVPLGAAGLAALILVGLGGEGPLKIRLLAPMTADGTRVVSLRVAVHNGSDETLTPRFAVQTDGLQPSFWFVRAGPPTLAPGADAIYEIDTDVPFSSFEIRRGARVTVSDAHGYEPRATARVAGQPGLARPDFVPNGDFTIWEQRTRLPSFWGQQGEGDIRLAPGDAAGPATAVSLTLPAAGETGRLVLDTYFVLPHGPVSFWVNPPAGANRGEEPAVVYAVEIQSGAHRAWVMPGWPEGPGPELDGVRTYGVAVTADGWTQLHIPLDAVVAELGIAPEGGRERVPRFKQLDMALTPVNLQLALIARGPHSETTALFGPVATVEDSPQVGRLVDEGLANPHWTLIWRAEHNLALRNYERAEQYFRQALDATPESGRATLGLAEINFWNADYAAAVVAYERAIELGEQPGVGYKGIGWSEYNRGAYVEATRAFGAALAILREEGDPRSPHVRDALRGTAYALAARGECTRAVAALVSASIHAMPEPVSRHCPKDAERGE